MKKILSAFIVITMVLSVLPNMAIASEVVTAETILEEYNMTVPVRSDNFTSQTSLDTSFWNVTGATSGIINNSFFKEGMGCHIHSEIWALSSFWLLHRA